MATQYIDTTTMFNMPILLLVLISFFFLV